MQKEEITQVKKQAEVADEINTEEIEYKDQGLEGKEKAADEINTQEIEYKDQGLEGKEKAADENSDGDDENDEVCEQAVEEKQGEDTDEKSTSEKKKEHFSEKINLKKNKKSLNTISKNLLSYLSDFFTVTDILELSKVNKRLKEHLSRNNIYLKKLLEIRHEFKDEFNHSEIIDVFPLNFCNKFSELQKDKNIANQFKEILELFFRVCLENKMLKINEDSTKFLEIIKLILNSDICSLIGVMMLNPLDEIFLKFLISSIEKLLSRPNNNFKRLCCRDILFMYPEFSKILLSNEFSKIKELDYLSGGIFDQLTLQWEEIYLTNFELFFTTLEESSSINYFKCFCHGLSSGMLSRLSKSLARNKSIKSILLKYLEDFSFIRENSTIENVVVFAEDLSISSLGKCLDKTYKENDVVLPNVNNVKLLKIYYQDDERPLLEQYFENFKGNLGDIKIVFTERKKTTN